MLLNGDPTIKGLACLGGGGRVMRVEEGALLAHD